MNQKLRALCVCLVAAFAAGCGGGGSAGSGSATLPSSPAARHATSGGSLLYVSVPASNAVSVFSYPDGTPMTTLTGFDDPMGMCSDANGNVWVTNAKGGTIVEYAHGGSTPIATLQDTGGQPVDCAIDPKSGNLAVANSGDSLAVYKNAKGSPTYYSTAGVKQDALFVTYDGSGNLFFSSAFQNPGVLAKGSSSVREYFVRPHFGRHNGLHWDGRYLTLMANGHGIRQIPRYDVSGKRGKGRGIVDITLCCSGQYWIAGSTLITAAVGNVYFFDYPAGGAATKTITRVNGYGVTVSTAPSRR